MRTIKFKAWDINHKKWYSRVHIGTNCCHSVYDEERQMWLEFDELCGEVVQYIGRKDKNGKEIYEGDILLSKYDDGNYNDIVRWSEEHNAWVFVGTEVPISGRWDDLNDPEIIGNIYENPELLKKGESA